ncbi:hypothetical protein ACVINW_003619 [Bradyrhizobium sp. USDA 4461]
MLPAAKLKYIVSSWNSQSRIRLRIVPVSPSVFSKRLPERLRLSPVIWSKHRARRLGASAMPTAARAALSHQGTIDEAAANPPLIVSVGRFVRRSGRNYVRQHLAIFERPRRKWQRAYHSFENALVDRHKLRQLADVAPIERHRSDDLRIRVNVTVVASATHSRRKSRQYHLQLLSRLSCMVGSLRERPKLNDTMEDSTHAGGHTSFTMNEASPRTILLTGTQIAG